MHEHGSCNKLQSLVAAAGGAVRVQPGFPRRDGRPDVEYGSALSALKAILWHRIPSNLLGLATTTTRQSSKIHAEQPADLPIDVG